MVKKILREEDGNIGIGVIMFIVLLILIGFPILSQMVERERLNVVREDTMESVDYALRSALTSISIDEASSEIFDFNSIEFNSTFMTYLAYNMKLNPDLSVTDQALVDGDVEIVAIEYHGTSDLPYINPRTGKVFNRPFFTVELDLIINPSMFRQIILDLMGVDDFHYTFVHNVSMPIDN